MHKLLFALLAGSLACAAYIAPASAQTVYWGFDPYGAHTYGQAPQREPQWRGPEEGDNDFFGAKMHALHEVQEQQMRLSREESCLESAFDFDQLRDCQEP